MPWNVIITSKILLPLSDYQFYTCDVANYPKDVLMEVLLPIVVYGVQCLVRISMALRSPAVMLGAGVLMLARMNRLG